MNCCVNFWHITLAHLATMRVTNPITVVNFQPVASGKPTKSDWKWPLIVDLSIKHGDFPKLFCKYVYQAGQRLGNWYWYFETWISCHKMVIESEMESVTNQPVSQAVGRVPKIFEIDHENMWITPVRFSAQEDRGTGITNQLATGGWLSDWIWCARWIIPMAHWCPFPQCLMHKGVRRSPT